MPSGARNPYSRYNRDDESGCLALLGMASLFIYERGLQTFLIAHQNSREPAGF
jgi:hypothetical protein